MEFGVGGRMKANTQYQQTVPRSVRPVAAFLFGADIIATRSNSGTIGGQ
jgi:hypothetical protein